MSSATLPNPPAQVSKPRMRGWIHLWSFFVSLVAGGTLIAVASSVSARAALATSIYTVTILGLFGISALYHRRTWVTEGALRWMRRLDHSMIFLFIAGTYTPFCLLAMDPGLGSVILAVVWGGALAGVTLKLAWPEAPRWLGVPIYIALGWVAIFVLPELGSRGGITALVLLLVGGLFYTVGGIMYGIRRPNPWPEVFGFHEFFHAATALAAVCHYIAVWLVLFP
ncbi:hemolysin III family protein [Crossiella sp. CA-258035]|uniref:PAQR family membrane homeostasis protein TrhA n=1 Tax=Crossiella sp. CA-258035 TaxID=2981138 RepID=UPI0024BCA98F|nr:hemolysin III family protein [Crossiella sp. CA-258035]WHT18672.1 hemolysin III family protein [Crossiella sp. CA-258035]